MMIKTFKVMLLPNNKQKTKLFSFAKTARYAYNWALDKQIENFKLGNKFINDCELRREFTIFKSEPKNNWLYEISNNVTKQAIKDVCIAYKNFFDKQKKKGYERFTKETREKAQKQNKKLTVYNMNGHPKFKKKSKTLPSFYVDTDKIEFSKTHVKLEKLSNSKRKNRLKTNWVKLAEYNKIPF